MKKIKLLALLVIVAFVAQDLLDMTRGFTDGMQAAGDSTEYNAHFDLAVQPTPALVPDTLQGVTNGVKAPYWATRIEGYGRIQKSVPQIALSVVVFPLALFVLYGIYCLIRLVISVLRGSVFTRKNVLRMRLFVYSALLLGVLSELLSYASYLNVAAHVDIPGYEVVYSGQRAEICLAALSPAGPLHRDIRHRRQDERRTGLNHLTREECLCRL